MRSVGSRVRTSLVVACGVLALAASSAGAATIAPADRSPVDPLNEQEIEQAVAIIEGHANFPKGAFFPLVTLKEPPKAEVLAWNGSQNFRREALVHVYDRAANRLSEVVVDLRQNKVASWTAKPGRQPGIFVTEYADADKAIRADPQWRNAMRDRGLAPKDVYIDVWAPGELDVPGTPPGARIVRAINFFRGNLPNVYDRPIEGVLATVNMNTLKVINVTDTGVRPNNTTSSGAAKPPGRGIKPLVVQQPEGASFGIRGTKVEWAGWEFRVGYGMREGLVLYGIKFAPSGPPRSVIHRIAMDELFVPYGIPDPTWIWRGALDIGEYNTGQYMEPLATGVDVPTNAVFFDVDTATDTSGDPSEGSFPLPHAIAMYERDNGSMWDRTDPTSFEREARMARELVVTGAFAIGNYTYRTEYTFRLDGGIDVNVGSTGTTLNRGVRNATEGAAFGQLVAPLIAAPNHQHFFDFRIDFDVDGTQNRLVEENTRSVPSSAGNAFEITRDTITTEGFRDTNPTSNRHWVVQNATRLNAVGMPTSYRLHPEAHTPAYADANNAALKRAPFAQHALWATAYRDGELYSSGDFPNQGEAGEGLPSYTADHANINAKDLVVWFATGFTHVPAVEDYPVMNRDVVGFTLRPNGFFDENPALDAPAG